MTNALKQSDYETQHLNQLLLLIVTIIMHRSVGNQALPTKIFDDFEELEKKTKDETQLWPMEWSDYGTYLRSWYASILIHEKGELERASKLLQWNELLSTPDSDWQKFRLMVSTGNIDLELIQQFVDNCTIELDLQTNACDRLDIQIRKLIYDAFQNNQVAYNTSLIKAIALTRSQTAKNENKVLTAYFVLSEQFMPLIDIQIELGKLDKSHKKGIEWIRQQYPNTFGPSDH